MADMAASANPIPEPVHRRSIGRLLIAIGALTSFVILMLSLLLSFRLSSEGPILEDMAEVMQSVSNETVENTASFLAPAERNSAELMNLIQAGHLAPDSSLPADRLFFEMLRVYESFDGIFIGGSDGSFLYVNRDLAGDGYSTKEITIDSDGERVVANATFDANFRQLSSWLDPADQYDPRQRPWYMLATQDQTGQGVWTDPYLFFSSGLPGVTRAHYAPTSPRGLEIVVGIDMRIEELSTFIDSRRASTNGVSFIVDRELNVVAHPDKSVLANDDGLATTEDVNDPLLGFVSDRVEDLGDRRASELLTGTVDGVDHHFVLTSLSNNDGWVVAVTAPDDDFLGRVRDAQRSSRTLSALGGFGSVATLLAGGFVVDKRYRSERALAEAALAASVDRSDERDAARATLAQTVDELARSNADLEQYAYATAHDLRTPLRAIGGYAELLLREAEGDDADPEVVGYAQRIVEGYERMCLTMDNLLEHARTTLHEPAANSLPLGPIVEDALSDFEEEIARSGTSVNVGLLPSAAVDPIAMRRVFQNLISNSMKYQHPDRDCQIEIQGEQVGDVTVIRIADNGVGIAAGDQDRAFRLFSRVSTDDSGTGVGLALVKKLIEEHHGTITIESAADEGATFTISLPTDPVGDALAPNASGVQT